MFMKLAIVYDWLDKYGGAERILTQLFKCFHEADIYTLYADLDKAVWAKPFASRIHTTFLQRFYNLGLPKSVLAPLMPFAIESLNLTGYDRVLSLSSSFAKGVITRPECRHICYLFAPTRFLWHHRDEFFPKPMVLLPVLSWLRQWDVISSQRPDQILTLSRYDQKLISKFYHRTSKVLRPSFAPDYWQKLKLAKPKGTLPKAFFLVASRLEPYKRVDLAIKAFNRFKNKQLIIVGRGTEKKKLQRLAMRNILFLQDLSDKQLGWLYKQAQALIMPQEEDFGYTALEAIALSTPVIAYQHSGTAEIVDRAGYLFREQTVESIMAAVEKYHTKSYNFVNFAWDRYAPERFLEAIKHNIS